MKCILFPVVFVKLALEVILKLLWHLVHFLEVSTSNSLLEISLLFGKMKRTASIKCVTPCVLYSLSKKQLDEVLLHHPQMNSAIRAVAELRLREAGKIKEEEEQKVAEKENLILSVDQKIDIKHSTIEQAHEDGSNEEVESLI